MSSLGSPNPFFIAGKKAYEIERSLRVNDDDSAYLSRTPSSAGNRRTFTISLWTKRANLTGALFGSYISDADRATLRFTSDYLEFQSAGASVKTNAVFRDSSAWYHIVCAIDTTQGTQSNRGKLYVNGVQQELSSNNFSQDVETSVNNNSLHVLGTRWASGSANMLYDGYLAEVHLIDGSALTPSSFAETDAVTGEYKPKKFVGSYGTNGYYLNFSDNSGTTATTLGKDSSGNGNNWTPNNFATGDSVKDSPTNNFATFRLYGTPAASGALLAEGNLKFTTGSSGSARNLNRQGISTFLPTSGKWYAEVRVTGGSENNFIGVSAYQVGISPSSNNSRYVYYYGPDGQKYVNTNGSESNANHGAGYGNDDIVGIYIDMDAGTPTVYFSKNGQWADGSGNSDESTPTSGITLGDTFFTTDAGGHTGIGIIVSSSSGGSSVNYQANFGQDSTFSGLTTAGGNTDANAKGDFKYTVPTGAKALCSANLPDPTIKLPDDHFNTVLWSGNGTNGRTISGVGFDPDWTWIKCRSDAVDHLLYDTVRGGNKVISSNATAVESSSSQYGYLSAFASDGFTLTQGTNGTHPMGSVNHSGRTYAAWNWKAGGSASSNGDGSITSSVSVNASVGFSIVSWTSTGTTGSTIGHGLGVKPSCIILKGRNTTDAQPWRVYHSKLGATKSLMLDATDAAATQTGVWNDTEPTSSVFTVGSFSSVNENTKNYIAYCFSEVAGFSKFGSYRGNQNANGTFVFTGFRPALVITKGDWGGNWNMYDNSRNPFNVANKTLYPNLNNAESTESSSGNQMDLLSNGFKLRGSNNDTNHAADFVYLAFAESPFKYARAR
tara:strand:+ start:2864 stop:5368 length:2505 start_codon:yes stop_codon:yes gene_type:complete